MKKVFLFLILSFTFSGATFSQQSTLWQSLPLDFNHNPTHVLTDTVHGVSYLYGFFDKVDGDSCNIIRMDSSGFTLMPSVPVPVYNGVSATLYQDQLYLGGDYRIARWNGASWDSISVSGSIYYLYSHNNKLYACGSFDSIAHTYVNNLAVWDGITWTAIPGLDTFLDLENSLMYNIIWYKNELYVSGVLSKQGGVQSLTLIRFDGQQWKDVEGQIAGNQGPGINDMLVWKDTLYVCGTFRESNGGAGNGIAKWDGENWHALQRGVFMGDQPTVNDMIVFNDELYVAGWFNTINGVSYQMSNGWSTGFAKWDGTQWCSLGAIANGVILNLGYFEDTLYVMGTFDTLNNQPAHYMGKWIGGDYTDSCIQQTTGIVRKPAALSASLSLFPNPASRTLNVQYQVPMGAETPATINIFDLTGRCIQSEVLSVLTRDNYFRLNIAGLLPGMYFLEICNEQTKMTAKFMKQ